MVKPRGRCWCAKPKPIEVVDEIFDENDRVVSRQTHTYCDRCGKAIR